MLLITILQCVSKYEILKNVSLPEIIHKGMKKEINVHNSVHSLATYHTLLYRSRRFAFTSNK
jgi:hypothetical protein